jgi:hypothetical protein
MTEPAGSGRSAKEARAAWRRRWQEVPAEQRRAVAVALRRGVAVDDPALAEIAAEAAERQLQDRIRQWRLLTFVYLALAVIWILRAIQGDDTAFVFIVCWVALAIVNAVSIERRRERLEHALAANRELAAPGA